MWGNEGSDKEGEMKGDIQEEEMRGGGRADKERVNEGV